MSLAANPYVQYRQNAVQTAAPGELTLMLYSGLVKFIRQSIIAIEQKDLKASNDALIRSQEIVAYLNETLDHGFELSKSLSAIYEYMGRRLMEANVKKDAGIAGEMLGMAEGLRDTWMQAMKLAREINP